VVTEEIVDFGDIRHWFWNEDQSGYKPLRLECLRRRAPLMLITYPKPQSPMK